MSKPVVNFHINLPWDLYEALKKQAAQNCTNMSAEIIRSLRKTMDKGKKKAEKQD